MLDVACHCINLRRAARSLTEVYDRALAPAGLRVTQYSLLRAIRRLGRPTITELARATGLDRSTLGRNLRVLAREGLVAVGAGADERTRVVGLTPRAGAALGLALPHWQAAQRAVDAVLGAEGEAALVEVASRLGQLGDLADGDAR